MLRFDPKRVRDNARAASTEDLLDRVTVYRNGMEPEALEIIEAELYVRGVQAHHIEAHARDRSEEVILLPDGTARPCSFCHRPAVEEGWGWHWISIMALGKRRPIVPVFPRYYYYCDEHQPPAQPELEEEAL